MYGDIVPIYSIIYHLPQLLMIQYFAYMVDLVQPLMIQLIKSDQ